MRGGDFVSVDDPSYFVPGLALFQQNEVESACERGRDGRGRNDDAWEVFGEESW